MQSWGITSFLGLGVLFVMALFVVFLYLAFFRRA